MASYTHFARSAWFVALAAVLTGCAFDVESDTPMTNRNPAVAKPSAHGIPQVVPTIPREGLWSGYNQLGYEAKYGPDQRQTQTILKLDEWGPPEVWTVSLFVRGSFKSFNGFDIRARINFGAGGSTQVVEMDWLNGAQISLPMNAINVEAIFSDVDVLTEGRGLSLGVQLARGQRGGDAPPVYTFSDTILLANGGTSEGIEIPKFAKAVYLQPCEASAAALSNFYDSTLVMIVGSGNAIGSNVAGIISGQQLGLGMKLPVISDGRIAFVVNNTGSLVSFKMVADLYG